jgi:hypothetical protein
MIETAAMLEQRLELVDRVRRVERDVARDEHARAAAALLRGKAHDLGNLVQIIRIASIEIEKRADERILELVADLRLAAEQATAVLAALVEVARPAQQHVAGAAVAPTLAAAVDRVRPAVTAPIELALQVDDRVATSCTAAELEAIAIASLLDVGAATRVAITARERTIHGVRWVELLRLDDRRDVPETAVATAFQPYASPGPGLAVVHDIVAHVGGEVSLAPGRGGLELAIALPVVA